MSRAAPARGPDATGVTMVLPGEAGGPGCGPGRTRTRSRACRAQAVRGESDRGPSSAVGPLTLCEPFTVANEVS